MSKKGKIKTTSKWNLNDITWDQFKTYGYRSILNLDKEPCPPGSCKKNCLDNLYCLNQLGENKWITVNSNGENLSLDESNESNFAAGLKNYGSTCYLNSLLQVYFNIFSLKQSVLDFPLKDIPDEIMKYLQIIFTQMHFSFYKCVDPVELINALELSQLEQQDAPEFHNLFMNLLDSRFDTIDNPVITNLFTGKQSYCTKCKCCNYISKVDSNYKEIDLKVLPNLDLTLTDFLQVESLDGNNKYNCPSCQNMCDGERYTQFKQLPPIICFQLLRYSYDNYGNKKKNSANIIFPTEVNMEKYISKNKSPEPSEEPLDYVLKAILIHIGTEPTRGHYQTFVHNSNDDWIFYDDTNVKKMDNVEEVQKILGNKKLSQIKSDSNTRKSLKKEPNGVIHSNYINFQSSNAYMLFYERKDIFNNDLEKAEMLQIPEELKTQIKNMNETYLHDKESRINQKQEEADEWTKKSQKVKECFEELRSQSILSKSRSMNINTDENDKANVNDGDDDILVIIPTSWFHTWLNSATYLSVWDEEISKNSLEYWKPLLCAGKHNLIGPDFHLGDMKLVRLDGLMKLQQNNFISKDFNLMHIPRDLCVKCWRLKFELKRFDHSSKLLIGCMENCLKKPLIYNDNEKQYWASKHHLKQWRKIIRGHIENIYSTDAQVLTSKDTVQSIDESMQQQSDNLIVFNSDVICSHFDLSVDSSKRLIISHDNWLLIKNYFLELTNHCNSQSTVLYHELKCSNDNIQGCPKCNLQASEIADKAEKEKESLQNLLSSKKRFDYIQEENCLVYFRSNDDKISIHSENATNSNSEKQVFYLIPNLFVNKWKKFLKNPSIESSITELDYSEVFCKHDQTRMFNTWYNLVDDESLTIIFYEEWSQMVNFYSNLQWHPLKLTGDFISTDSNHNFSNQWCNIQWMDNISGHAYEICELCYSEWQSSQSSITNFDVFIRLINDADENPYSLIDKTDIYNDHIPLIDSNQSEDQKAKNKIIGKKRKKQTIQEINDNKQQQKNNSDTNTQDLAVLRRSNRSKRHRSDISVRISSKDTVRDLKLQLMNAYSASPMDQHLIFKEVELTDLNANLSELGVGSASIIYLVLDKPSTNDYVDTVIETGFSGTKLLESNRL